MMLFIIIYSDPLRVSTAQTDNPLWEGGKGIFLIRLHVLRELLSLRVKVVR